MAQSLHDWLGNFIESELGAVIRWRSHIKPEPGSTDEILDRFGDDGSNFQSTITHQYMPSGSQLQLIKVLAVDDVPTLLVTDGFTSIKATLSDAALTILESELDEKLSLDLKGDVIYVTEATVISTPYGPTDGFVQLHINTLEYRYSLRKTWKDFLPVHQRNSVMSLLEQITAIRHQPDGAQPTAVKEVETSLPIVEHSSPDPVLGAPQPEADAAPTHRPLPAPMPMGTAQKSSQVVDPSSQFLPSITSQVASHKKRRGPTLEADGFETQTGVNLARPMPAPNGAYGTTPTSYQVQLTQKQATGRTDPVKLLGLFRNARPASPPRKLAKPRQPDPIVIEDDPSTSVEMVASGHSSRRPSLDAQSQVQARLPSSPPTVPLPAPRSTPRLSYARRKLPQNQRKLLDAPHSWFPPLPGRTFPSPNVPIQLLAEWSVSLPSPDVPSPQKTSIQAVVSPAHDDDRGSDAMESASESEDSSSDEELGASQWPASSPLPQKREELPPDSSAAAMITNQEEPKPSDRVGSSQRDTAQPTPIQRSNRASQRIVNSDSLPKPVPSSPRRGVHKSSPVHPPRPSASVNDVVPPLRTGSQYKSSTQTSRQQQLPPNEPDEDKEVKGKQQALNIQFRRYLNDLATSEKRAEIITRVKCVSCHQAAVRPHVTNCFHVYCKPCLHYLHRTAAGRGRDQPRCDKCGQAVSNTQECDFLDNFTKPQTSGSAQADAVEGRRSSTAQRRLARSPVTHSVPAKSFPPSSGLETVIKGTQYSTISDEMEMDVPRALPSRENIPAAAPAAASAVDPAVIFRQKRTEHFANAKKLADTRKREWLKTHYVVHPESGPFVHEVLKTYREASPERPITGPELKVLLRETFPGFDDFPPKSLRRKVSITDPSEKTTQRPSHLSKESLREADVPHTQGETDGQKLRPAITETREVMLERRCGVPGISESSTSSNARRRPALEGFSNSHDSVDGGAEVRSLRIEPDSHLTSKRPVDNGVLSAAGGSKRHGLAEDVEVASSREVPSPSEISPPIPRASRPRQPPSQQKRRLPWIPSETPPSPPPVPQRRQPAEHRKPPQQPDRHLPGAQTQIQQQPVASQTVLDESVHETPRHNQTRFQDFALAWSQLNPSGAFARQNEPRQERREQEARHPSHRARSGEAKVDVLSWGL